MKSFIQSLFNFIKYLKINNKDNLIFFYSESIFYREHCIDLINYCVKNNKKNFVFVSSDYQDFLYHKKILNCLYFENGFFLYLFFKMLKCKCMVMTLTDLGNHVKKSKNCRNYIYFFHSLSSTFIRCTKEAFKNYDIMFTNGDYQKNELIESENIFNFPKKKIINTGYFFLDHLTKKTNLNARDIKKIIFAPTWNYNKNNIFNDYGYKIIDILIKNNYFVILRPHPEHYKRSLNVIKKINKTFKSNENFFLDKNSSNLNSLERSSILITDNSSIDMEFALIFKRPVIYLDYIDKIHNLDYKMFSSKNIDVEFKNTIGNSLEIAKLNELPTLIADLLSANNKNEIKIDEFREKYLSNINGSSKFAADYIISNFINN